jgi:hypothetical protein
MPQLEPETFATAELQASEQVVASLTDFTSKSVSFVFAIGRQLSHPWRALVLTYGHVD